MITGFVNPIPKRIEHVSEIYDQYNEYETMAKKLAIIPRFGRGFGYSQLLTEVTKALSTLSPSQTACSKQITRWTIGSALDIKRDSIPGLREYPPVYQYREDGGIARIDDKREVVGFDEKVKFAKLLDSYGLSLTGIISTLSRLHSEQLMEVGDGYLHIKVVKVGRTKKVYLRVLDYTRCAVIDLGGKRDLALMYVESFDTNTWSGSSKPKFYKLSDMNTGFVWETKKGVSETVLRISQQSGKYYSKSTTAPIMTSMYNEVVLSETTSKLVGHELLVKAFIAFEGKSPREKDTQSDMQVSAEAFREITTTKHGRTNKAGSSLALLEYGFGKRPPEIGKFTINRDTAWIETVSNQAVRNIHGVHSWPPELTALKSYKSGRSGNDITQMYVFTDENVIRPLQFFYESLMSAVFNELGSRFGIKLDYTIAPVRHIEEMVNRMSILK